MPRIQKTRGSRAHDEQIHAKWRMQVLTPIASLIKQKFRDDPLIPPGISNQFKSYEQESRWQCSEHLATLIESIINQWGRNGALSVDQVSGITKVCQLTKIFKINHHYNFLKNILALTSEGKKHFCPIEIYEPDNNPLSDLADQLQKNKYKNFGYYVFLWNKNWNRVDNDRSLDHFFSGDLSNTMRHLDSLVSRPAQIEKAVSTVVKQLQNVQKKILTQPDFIQDGRVSSIKQKVFNQEGDKSLQDNNPRIVGDQLVVKHNLVSAEIIKKNIDKLSALILLCPKNNVFFQRPVVLDNAIKPFVYENRREISLLLASNDQKTQYTQLVPKENNIRNDLPRFSDEMINGYRICITVLFRANISMQWKITNMAKQMQLLTTGQQAERISWQDEKLQQSARIAQQATCIAKQTARIAQLEADDKRIKDEQQAFFTRLIADGVELLSKIVEGAGYNWEEKKEALLAILNAYIKPVGDHELSTFIFNGDKELLLKAADGSTLGINQSQYQFNQLTDGMPETPSCLDRGSRPSYSLLYCFFGPSKKAKEVEAFRKSLQVLSPVAARP